MAEKNKKKKTKLNPELEPLKLLIGIRLLVVSLILGLGSLVLMVEPFSFYALIGGFYFFSIIYLLLLKTKISFKNLVGFQLCIDVLLILGVLYFSGGTHSIFISLLLFPLIAGGLTLSFKRAVILNVFTSIGYIGLSVMEYFGLVPVTLYGVLKHNLNEMLFIASLRLAIMWSASLLSSFLADKMRLQTGKYLRLKQLHDIILEQIGSGIITVNAENEIIYVNSGAEQLIGAPAEELVGTSWKPLFFFTNSNFPRDQWEESAQVVRGYEVSLKRKDGTKIPIGFNVSKLTDQNNQYCGKVMIFRDLTRIKELERKQRQSERLAAIGEMAAGIAHEIRNPLASISGSVEVLMNKKAFDQKYGSLIDVILREAQRLNGIIESFLNYTRRPELEKRLVDIENILDEVVTLLKYNGKWRDSHKINKINLIKGKTRFWFDPNQVKQVFYNLISNACEVMPNGGEIEIKLSETEESPPQIRIDVSDQGVGITEEKLSQIFTPFYTTKKYGTGLGLAIVYRIIQEHGGSIEVSSQIGKGTRFSVYLPRGEEAVRAA